MPPTKKEFKKPKNVGTLPIKVDAPVAPEAISGKFKPTAFTKPPVVGPVISMPKIEAPTAVRTTNQFTPAINAVLKKQPLNMTRLETATAGLSPIAKQAATKQGFVGKTVAEMKGGVSALLGDKLTTGEKTKAVASAIPRTVMAIGSGVRRLLTTTFPEAIAVGAQMVTEKLTQGEDVDFDPTRAMNKQQRERFERATPEQQAALTEKLKGKNENMKKATQWLEYVALGYREKNKEMAAEAGVDQNKGFFTPENFGAALGEGGGSTAAIVGLTMIGANPTLATLAVSWVEGSQTYLDAKDKITANNPEMSQDDVEKRAATLALTDTAGIAVLERISLGVLLSDKNTLRVINKITETSLTEMATEGVQTVWSNALAKYGYDESRKVLEGVVESMVIGFASGALLGGIAAGSAPARAPYEDPEKEELAKEIEQKVAPIIEKQATDLKNVINAPEADDLSTTEALYEDIKAEIAQKGEAAVIEQLTDEDLSPMPMSEVEAKELVAEAQKPFAQDDTQVPDDIMASIAAATAMVKGEVTTTPASTPTTTESKPITEPQGTEGVFENIPDNMIEEATTLWEDQYADEYTQLENERAVLETQAETAQGQAKVELEQKIVTITEQIDTKTEEFTNEVKQVEAKKTKEKIAKAVQAVEKAIQPVKTGDGVRVQGESTTGTVSEVKRQADGSLIADITLPNGGTRVNVPVDNLITIDKQAESSNINDNDNAPKSQDNNTRSGLRQEGDTSRDGDVGEGQGVRGSADTVDSDGVAQRGSVTSGSGVGERLRGTVDVGTEEVVYTEAGVVSITRTTPIAEKQNTKLGKVIVDLIKQQEQSLADESLYMTIQSQGYMPLHIERLITNELAVSHTFIQNGDLMRDPEVVFNIDRNGQLVAKTIQMDGVYSGTKEIKPNDSFLNTWATNIREQGFVKPKEKTIDPGVANRAEISALEADLRAIYLGAKAEESPMEGFTKADEVLSNIMTELELAEAGGKVIVNGEFQYAYNSTFPSWVPDNARNKEDVMSYVDIFRDVRGLSFPKSKAETKRRDVANALFDEMDQQLGVNTSTLRDKILKLYEETSTRETQEPTTPQPDSTTGDQKGAEDERGGVTSSDVESLIKDHAYLTVSNRVEITNNKLPTQAVLKTINTWEPAGGREAQGAEGRGLLDEYYTPTPVIDMVRAMLSKVGAYAKPNVTVLEPSVGIGNFLYSLPSDAKVTGYEINEISARIAKLNHPTASIVVQPLEEVFVDSRGNKKVPQEKYDVVVGNPPYGKHRGKYKGLGEEANIVKYEIYFMKRSLDLTNDGGYVAMVVPSSFLRNQESEAGKEAMAMQGELVAAVRLPNGSFATTGIGTDILVFKKNPTKDLMVAAARTKAMSNDSYFAANPDKVLGTAETKTGRFGEEQVIKGSIEDAYTAFENTDLFMETPKMVPAPEPQSPATAPREVVERAEDAEVTERVRTDEDTQKAEMKAAGITLGTEVERFIDTSTVEAGTVVKKDGSSLMYVKTATEEVLWDQNWYARSEVTATTPSNLMDLGEKTRGTYESGLWAYVSATGELQGNFDATKAYYMAGKYYNEFNYAQGDIYAKLEQLEKDKSVIGEAQYEKQKAVLEAIKPAVMTVDRFRMAPHTHFTEQVNIGSITLQAAFLKWVETLPMTAFNDASRKSVRQYTLGEAVRGGDKEQNEAERRNRRFEGDRLFKLFLTEELTPAQKTIVENEFNRRFNSYVKPDYLQVPLLTKISSEYKGRPLVIKDVQRQGIGFLLNKGTGLLAHDVGLGKTMQGVIANIELLERGWAKRPLVVLPSASVYAQWVKDFKTLKPGIKINELSNLGKDFKGSLATLAIPEGTISVMTEEGFKKLGFTDATYKELTKDLQDVIENPNDKKTKRQVELEGAKTEEQVGKAMRGTSTEKTFEDLGFDAITIDEIHNYNHIIGSAKAADGKATEFRGFSQQPSISGLKLWLAAQYIMQNNNGRNVIGLSATPFTNHPLEYYSILSLFARERMTQMGIRNVNDFMAMYMDVVAKDEVRADGTLASKLDVRGFNNAQQFQSLLREFIDFKDGDDVGIIRPTRNSREYIVPENRMSYDFKLQAQELFEEKEAGTLRAMTELQKIAFSPYASRYYTGPIPTAKQFVDNSPKIKSAVELLAETYHTVKDSNHLIYSNRGKEYLPLIKNYLVSEKGIPANEIELITGDTPKVKRTDIQNDFNAGKIRVVIGNEAIEEGINLQEKTTDLYILSQPWNFTAVRQVIGRAWRQGNKWKNVRINQFFTENTFDIFLSQAIEKKRVRYQQSLQSGSDYIDAGDVDYDAMKFDLMTDPVIRTRQEYNEKQKRLEQTIKREKSDFATKNRRNKDYVDAVAKIDQYKAYVEMNPDAAWSKNSLAQAERDLITLKTKLSDRGIDVATLDANLLATTARINDLEEQKKALIEEEKAALARAEVESQIKIDTTGTPDYKRYVQERQEDNKDLFLSGAPMFSRASSDHVTLAVLEAIQEEVKQDTISAETLGNFLARGGVKQVERETINTVFTELAVDGRVAITDLVAGVEKDLVLLSRDQAFEKYEYVALPDEIRGEIEAYQENVYQSGVRNSAADKHFDKMDFPNYFAHTRVEDLLDGVTRRVIEVQSDLMQRGGLESYIGNPLDKLTKAERAEFEQLAKDSDGTSLADEPARMTELREKAFSDNLDPKSDLAKLQSYRNSWWQRVIREEIKTASMDKKAFLQLPTGETAMKIEGLGTGALDIRDTNGRIISYEDLKPGQIFQFWRDYDGEDFNRVVTEVLGDGKLKATKFSAYENAGYSEEELNPELAVALAKQLPEVKRDEETFDISGEADPNNPIYKFYEKEVGRWLTSNYGAKKITDDNGVTWWAIGVPADAAIRPVYAFQTTPTRDMERRYDGNLSKGDRNNLARSLGFVEGTNIELTETKEEYKIRMRATTFEQAKAQLERYQKRFNLKFDVELVDKILTGKKTVRAKVLSEVEAYAVYYNRAVAMTKEMPRTTADHEFIHLVLDNIGKIGTFEGMTKQSVLTAANGGRSITNLTEAELQVLEEKVAVGFEMYIIRRALSRADREAKYGKTLSDFYERLQNVVIDLARALNAIKPMADFYDRVARGQATNEETVVLIPNPVKKSFVTFETSEGLQYLDFGEVMNDKNQVDVENRQAFFSAIEPKEEVVTNKVFQNNNKYNFVMKDINTLEDVTAQARDIYLKDPEQFAVANELELIGESHDADKYRLDERMADSLKDYMDLNDVERKRVNEILWRGDEMAKEFDMAELLRMSLTDRMIKGYRAVRYSLDMAHEILLQEMIKKGVKEEEIATFREERRGYMPHKWIPKLSTAQKVKQFVTGKEVIVLKSQQMIEGDTRYKTFTMAAFGSEKEAIAEQKRLMAENKDDRVRFVIDKLSSLEVDFFSSQELSSERMIAVVENMREEGYIKDQVVDILKKNLLDMFKEKGFGRHYLMRTGVQGFDTENTEIILAEYFAGFSGYVTKMRWSTQYFLSLAKIDARRQQRFFAWSRDLIAYKLNNKPEWRMARTIAFTWYLANDLSYLLTNATQNLIVGMGELSKHVKGADKAWKPEAYIAKATTDWLTKNVTPDEMAAINGLLEKGQLGAEMTSELMGFANNPLYRNISNVFSKVMYSSTAIVEKNVNRIPAFLAARRVFIEQGYSPASANERALEVSNDIHFRYGRHHRPRMLRGRINVLFVFQNYLRTFLYQLYRDASNREFVSLGRKMFYTMGLGGTLALPFAKLLLSIFKGIADDEEDEELKKEITTWEILITRGIPATFDIDLSGRVGIELLSITKIADAPSDVRTYMGVIGDLIFSRPFQVADLMQQQRFSDATAKLLPDMLANPIRAYNGYTYGVRSFAGVPLLDANGDTYKYSGWEAVLKAVGYTPTQEALLWEEKAKEWKRTEKTQEERTEISRTIRGMVQRGEFQEAREFQDIAREKGLIAEKTDYIRQFAKDEWFTEAVDTWTASDKSRTALKELEENLIEKVYGGVATDDQRNTVRKELAVYRQFGMDNPQVSDIMKAGTNDEKVKILLEIKDNIGEEAFAEFLRNGRTGFYTEAGTRVPILFSDDLMEKLNKAQKNDNQN